MLSQMLHTSHKCFRGIGLTTLKSMDQRTELSELFFRSCLWSWAKRAAHSTARLLCHRCYNLLIVSLQFWVWLTVLRFLSQVLERKHWLKPQELNSCLPSHEDRVGTFPLATGRGWGVGLKAKAWFSECNAAQDPLVVLFLHEEAWKAARTKTHSQCCRELGLKNKYTEGYFQSHTKAVQLGYQADYQTERLHLGSLSEVLLSCMQRVFPSEMDIQKYNPSSHTQIHTCTSAEIQSRKGSLLYLPKHWAWLLDL